MITTITPPQKIFWDRNARLLISLFAIIFAITLGCLCSTTTQAYGATVTTGTITSEDDFDTQVSSKSIYFYDTLVTDSNVKITTSSSFTLMSSSSSTCGAYQSNLVYEVKTASSISQGTSRTYGSSSSPCVTIYVTGAGFTGDGTVFDVEYKINTISLYNEYRTQQICVLEFDKGVDLFSGGFWLDSYRANVQAEVVVTLYKTGTTTQLTGYDFIWKVTDLDQPGDTSDYSGTYSESVVLLSGFTNTVYTLENSYLKISNYTYNGGTYTKFTATKSDSDTLKSGLITTVSSGQIKFLWFGGRCGTKLALSSVGYTIGTPVKSVNESVVNLGGTVTYTVTEVIPYNGYSSIRFSDTLDSALNASSATVTVYRTDVSSGSSTRVNDTSNWTKTRSNQTITLTCQNPTSAGGTYEFVITTTVKSSADLSGYSTGTISGTSGSIIPNTATITCGSETKTSNKVNIVVPTATVVYKLVSTTNPSGSTVPSTVSSHAGASYKIESGLTTSDTTAIWYFDGWYSDSALTSSASGTITLPAGTTTLYGSWSKSSISLTKTASVTNLTGDDAYAGYTVTYTYKITNTGGNTLTNLSLSDDKIGSITLKVSSLASGASTEVTATYNITQADVDAGYVTNTATVTSKNPGGVTVSDTDNATVNIEQNPEISLTKTPSTDTVDDAWAGTSTITYEFTITNTGNVTLDDFTLTDEKLGGDITIGTATLAPGKSTTVNVEYTLTQDDIDAASVYNTATVTAYSPLDKKVEDDDNCTVDIVWQPEIVLEKTSPDSPVIVDAYAGDVVTYSITVTNTGNVTLSDINVYDVLEGVSIDTTNLSSTLAPSESFTLTATYMLTQEDVDRGYIYNHAFVTSNTPDGEPGADDDDDVTVELPSNPSIELVKVATVDVVENAWAGISTITYIFTVENTGNTTLDDIVLTDPLLDSSPLTLYYASDITATVTTLAPGAKAIAAATYTVTQEDIDAGIVENTATVVGDDPHNTTVDASDDEDVEIERLPSIDIAKEVVGDVTIENAYAGDWVQFTITITNTGNTTLYDATITDLLEGATFVVDELEGVTFTEDNTVIVEKMSPEDSVTVYVDYQLTQADVDRGDTENIASVVADPPTGLEQITDDDDATIETPSDPSISLVKVANVESIEFALPGDVIYYTLTITNTGNTTISALTLYDELLAGEFEVFVVGDTDGSEDENGVSAEEDEIIEEDEIVEEADAVNTGYVTEALDKTTIAPGESAVAILAYTLTQDDIDAGYVYNTASATGEDPHGTSVDNEDDYTVELIASPSIMLAKTVAAANDIADEDLTVGDELTYTFIIANNGNQTITDITLYDELLGGDIDLTNAVKGIDMTVIGYEPAEEYANEYSMVEDETVGDETAVNDELVSIDDDTPLVGSEDDEASTDTADNDDAEAAGDATDNAAGESTGETDDPESIISDSALVVASRVYYTEHTEVSEDDPITTLRPGEYLIIEVNYTLTQDDLNNGRVDNTATSTGTAPDGSSVTNEDTAVMYLPQHPGIALLKEASSHDTLAAASVGDVIYYTLTITNTGDVSLTNLVLTDELEGIIIDASSLDDITLMPGETVVVTAEYALTANDLAVGMVYNHATVTAESVVPSDEGNIWSGAQQVSADDDALVDGIVAVADDLILPQTGEKILYLIGAVGIILLSAASAVTCGISRRRNSATS